MRYFLYLFLAVCLQSCLIKVKTGRPDVRFSEAPQPSAPDYSQLKNWAAHPNKEDNADKTPMDTMVAVKNAPVDVFFVHPTTYTYKPKTKYQWNGSLDDGKLNKKVDDGTILYQASIFNGAGNIYAPRYRQAQIYSFYTPFKEDRDSALNLAYADVKAAFLYYLENENKGKPFILASHSQGTVHTARLILELIDGKELQKQLVAAYLVGIPMPRDSFKNIYPCSDENSIQCLISWSTYAYGYTPGKGVFANEEQAANIISTNPITWKTDTKPGSTQDHKGAVLTRFNKVYPNVCDAENHNGMLWIHRPKFPGSFFIRKMKNYHIGDYNLFYMNVRENAIYRAYRFMHPK